MKAEKIVVKVSGIDVLNDLVVLGVDSKAPDKAIISNGDQFLLYKNGKEVEKIKQKFFYFILFCNGILYYEKEGEPIYFFEEFKHKKQFTEGENYFSPLQQRYSSNIVLITHMDALFNQKFYIYKKNLEKVLLPKHATYLLEDHFVNVYMGVIEFYCIENMEMIWSYKPKGEDEIEKSNKIFINENRIYVPLKGGSLAALDLYTGKEIWKWKGEAIYVYYGVKEDYIYVHAGNFLEVVSKYEGKSEKIVKFKDYPELQGFHANGIIWCFDKILVVRNSGTGEVVIFDRITFEVLERVIVDRTGIGESKERIQLVDGYLYIWSTGATLYIYNLNEILPDHFTLDH